MVVGGLNGYGSDGWWVVIVNDGDDGQGGGGWWVTGW